MPGRRRGAAPAGPLRVGSGHDANVPDQTPPARRADAARRQHDHLHRHAAPAGRSASWRSSASEGARRMTVEQRANLEQALGLRDPYVVAIRLSGSVTSPPGSSGKSLLRGTAVTQFVVRRGPITLEIALVATVISWVVGFPVGIISVVRPNSWLDHAQPDVLHSLRRHPRLLAGPRGGPGPDHLVRTTRRRSCPSIPGRASGRTSRWSPAPRWSWVSIRGIRGPHCSLLAHRDRPGEDYVRRPEPRASRSGW